jgi:hypothetical protein
MTAPESGIGKGETSGMVEAGGGVQGAPIADFALDRAGVGSIGRGRSDAGVKITVGALGLAERHLDVNAEDFFFREKPRDWRALFPLDNTTHG